MYVSENKCQIMLQNELSEIEKNFKNVEIVNKKVSNGSVGWHIDHSLKVMNTVCNSIKESNTKEYKPKFNITRSIVFALGYFPRGKVKSPKRVLPPENITLSDLKNQLETVRENLNSFNELEKDCFFTHPIFKQLNKKQTEKFLGLHTNHHLKIIRDIIK